METLDELNAEWENDCQIDETDLGRASARTPLLHSKYIYKLGTAKLRLRRFTAKFLALRRDKIRYYKGEMTREELNEKGWMQYQGVKPLKSEMNEILLVDEDLIDAESKVNYCETVVAYLESIMKSINTRTWDIKNSIEWNKIQNGII